MAPPKDRSLEVIILAGRGLSAAVPAGGRRKVQITLVSAKDPLGEAFGAKVSPWTAAGQGRALRFGISGLKCSFPLSGRRGAPSLAADPRFAESAEVCVRLFASQVSTKNSVIRTAAEILPTSVMDWASQEVDEATAQVEAEVKVPLANILSGRVGHAADRALGGWVPLRNCLDEYDGPLMGKEEIPPALWMQMYVLPDHEALVPKLQAQLNEETARQPKPAAAASQQAPARPAPKPKAAGAAAAASAPRWGPAPVQEGPTAQTVDDLIDVTLEDSHEQRPVNLLDDLDSLIDANNCTVGGLPTVAQSLPHLGSAPVACGESSSPMGLPVASGFGFMNGGYSAPQPVAAVPVLTPATAPASSGSSAFGFIAGSNQGAKLDLAALYASSEPPKASPDKASMANYSALNMMNFDMKTESAAAPKAAGPAPAPGSLESLEQSILADLKF